MKVLYMTVDDFFEEYVKAIKDKEIEVLKDKYRQIDVLLLDDIQFLSSKEKTKEVFFNIFNILFKLLSPLYFINLSSIFKPDC